MQLLAKLGQGVFSVWVWGSGFVLMFVAALATFPLLILGFPYTKVHRWVTAPMFSSCTRLATLRTRVIYHPDFDPQRPSVFCQNHINLLDGHIAALAIPHAFSGLMNAWQFKIPIYGWLMTAAKGIPVHTGRRGTMEDLTREALARQAMGMSILAFPEGHRTMTGKTGPFKRGVFTMARNAGMPVVPLAVRGLYFANNKNMGWFFRPFVPVEIFVGPQLETEGLDNSQLQALTSACRSYLQACLDEGAFPPKKSRDELLAGELGASPSSESSASGQISEISEISEIGQRGQIGETV